MALFWPNLSILSKMKFSSKLCSYHLFLILTKYSARSYFRLKMSSTSAHYPWWLFFKNLFHQKKCKGAIRLFKLGDTLTSCKKSENFYKWFWKKAPDKGTSRQMDVGYWIWPRFNMINLVLILVLYKIVLCSFCHYEQLKYCWLADLNAVGILNCFVFSISGQKPDKTIYTWSIHWSFINQVSLKLVP